MPRIQRRVDRDTQLLLANAGNNFIDKSIQDYNTRAKELAAETLTRTIMIINILFVIYMCLYVIEVYAQAAKFS